MAAPSNKNDAPDAGDHFEQFKKAEAKRINEYKPKGSANPHVAAIEEGEQVLSRLFQRATLAFAERLMKAFESYKNNKKLEMPKSGLFGEKQEKPEPKLSEADQEKRLDELLESQSEKDVEGIELQPLTKKSTDSTEEDTEEDIELPPSSSTP